MKQNIVLEKSAAFSIRIVMLYQYLTRKKHEYVMSDQIKRSGTSIGANVSESQNAQSKADFIHKMSIALKEADETVYWLTLLRKTNYLTEIEYDSMKKDADELRKLLISIIKTSKSRMPH
jgi:four helix bundle protein